MKNIIRFIKFLSIIFFIELLSIPLYGQLGVSLSSGNMVPLHELNAPKIKPFDINTYALSFSYVPKKIGVGLQLSSSSFKSNHDFFTQFENFDVQPSFQQEEWKNKFLFLGPIFRLGRQKFNLEFFPKFGLGKISSPNRQIIYQQGQEEFLLYKDNSEETKLNGTQLFYGFDTRLNIGITKRISTHLFAGISTNRFFGNGNSTIYREVNTSGNGITEEDLTSGRLLQLDCESYDLFTLGIGLSISLSKVKNKEQQSEVIPPATQFPENGSTLTLSQADSIIFNWKPETKKLKGTNYILSLYKINGDKDSLVFSDKIKNETTFNHTNKPALLVGKYKWIVQAVDARGIKRCKEGCFSGAAEFGVGSISLQYFELLTKPFANYALVKNTLSFIVDGDYYNQGNQLTYKVYDQTHQVVMTNTDEPLTSSFGDNRFQLNISCCLDCYHIYLLEVTNQKKEKRFLRFYITAKASPCLSAPDPGNSGQQN